MLSQFLTRFLSVIISTLLIVNTAAPMESPYAPARKRARTDKSATPARKRARTDKSATPATPDKPAATRCALFQSPYFRQTEQADPTNFCKMIIEALIAGDLDRVKQLFIHFILPISYIVKIESPNFYLALFSSLFSSLHGKNPNETTEQVIKIPGNNTVVTCIETDKTVYVLQYNIGQEHRNSLFTFNNIINPEKPLRVISFEHSPNDRHFTFDIVEIENDGSISLDVVPQTIAYDEANFYKRMLACFTGEQAGLEKFLLSIYVSIIPEWHILREKFYQSIFYCLASFFGNYNLTI